MGQKYSTIAISGLNSSPPSDDASQTDQNKLKWSNHINKIATPLANAITAIDAALVTAFDQAAILKTANFTTTLAENSKLIEVTGSNTILLLDASTGGAGYQINILNTGVGVVTAGRATAGNTINGVAGNWTLDPGNGASFRVNSTNNGYDVIGTALTTGARLADVLHTTGNESKSGVLTLTGVPVISMANPRLDIKDTGQTLPAGLWAVQSTGANFRVLRNLAGAGDFSSATVPFVISSADAATFTGTVSADTAISASNLVRKDQLDAKVYGGRITNAGTAAVAYGPSGWTVSRVSLGLTTVTHNLGTTNYSVVASTVNTGTVANPTVIATNSFNIGTVNFAGSSVDLDYGFVLARN